MTGRGLERKETLLRVYRPDTGCVFELRLSIDRGDSWPGIRFDEYYEYLPRQGDAGREYAYGVRTDLSSLGPLVGFFDARLDDDARGQYPPNQHLEDRLVWHLGQLVARGELGDALPLRENRDRVAAWFREAGVPAEPDSWSWFES